MNSTKARQIHRSLLLLWWQGIIVPFVVIVAGLLASLGHDFSQSGMNHDLLNIAIVTKTSGHDSSSLQAPTTGGRIHNNRRGLLPQH
jgi:hypothetical protein